MNRLLLVLLLTIAACSQRTEISHRVSRQVIPKEDPSPDAFSYYTIGYQLDTNRADLRTDGLYFRIVEADAFGDLYKTFRFYEDGMVIGSVSYSTPDQTVKMSKQSEGSVFGYYQAKEDSIAFTTMVYHNPIEIRYAGKLLGDSIQLKQWIAADSSWLEKWYYFFQES